MASYEELLQARPPSPERPRHYADLLLHPIHDDPISADRCYDGWEADHASKVRFYLGGTQWFRNNVGLSSNALAEYRKEGLKRLLALSEKGEIDWRYTPGCQDNDLLYWGDVARTQYTRSFTEKPILLSKAMIILMTCEVAIEKRLEEGAQLFNGGPRRISDPTEIYSRMRVIPVGWRVNGFNRLLLENMDPDERQRFLSELAVSCGRTDGETQFLVDLAEGRTVQFNTATKVRDFCESRGLTLGESPVRATPGTYMGRGDASVHERVFCG